MAVAEGRVVSGSFGHVVRVWDLTTGECLHVLQGHTQWVRAVAVADGRAVSGSEDKTVRVWDLATGECLHVLQGHSADVRAIAVAEGRVVSGSNDQTVRVWDLATGECLHVLEGHSANVMAVAIAEGRVVSGSEDKTVRVWDLESGQEVTKWEGEAGILTCHTIVLDIGANEERSSLVIVAGDRGGYVHGLQLLGDRERGPSMIRPEDNAKETLPNNVTGQTYICSALRVLYRTIIVKLFQWKP